MIIKGDFAQIMFPSSFSNVTTNIRLKCDATGAVRGGWGDSGGDRGAGHGPRGHVQSAQGGRGGGIACGQQTAVNSWKCELRYGPVVLQSRQPARSWVQGQALWRGGGEGGAQGVRRGLGWTGPARPRLFAYFPNSCDFSLGKMICLAAVAAQRNTLLSISHL